MNTQSVTTLINPQNGHLALKLFHFQGDSCFDHVQRNNYYSLIFINQGQGAVHADFTTYEIQENSVFCFSPYQPFRFEADENLKGHVLQFHSDFFCIHKHQDEVACNGVLFNNIYSSPHLHFNTAQEKQLLLVIEQIRTEMINASLAQYELLVSHLKVLLIHLSRLKVEQFPAITEDKDISEQPFILQNLKDAIENNFKTKHSASDYAEILNVSPKTLANLTKKHFNKTLTHLIAERIIIEAKRELYLTAKTVKEIAYELGYQDEYYFSRFFKANANVSPNMYRETLGFDAASR